MSTNREELIKETMEAYENDFIKTYGYSMNRQQRKDLEKRVAKIVDKDIKDSKKFLI